MDALVFRYLLVFGKSLRFVVCLVFPNKKLSNPVLPPSKSAAPFLDALKLSEIERQFQKTATVWLLMAETTAAWQPKYY